MHTLDGLIASYLIFGCIPVIIYVFFSLPAGSKKQFIIDAVIGGIVALALAKLSSKLYYDPRPFVIGHFTPLIHHANDNGFPSDHTLLGAFIGFLILRYNRTWGYIILVLALVVGLARVVAGVHHPIDIAGAFACAAVGMAMIYIVRKLLLERK